MNKGSLNSYAFNGRSLDAMVRSAIVGYAAAISVPRVSSIIGGSAFYVYGAASVTAVASSRLLLRCPAALLPQASATLKSSSYARSLVDGRVAADAYPPWNARIEVPVRSAIQGYASVVAAPNGGAITRCAVASTPQVVADPDLRAALRSPLTGLAEANGYVTPHSVVRYFYDKPALEESTFRVPSEDHVFYVR